MNALLLLLLSLVCAALSIFFYKKSAHHAVDRTLYFALLLATNFGTFVFLAAHYFTGRGIDHAALYHITYGPAGTGFGDYIGIMTATLGILFVSVVIAVWVTMKMSTAEKSSTKMITTAFALLLCSVLLHPALHDVVQLQYKNISNDVDPATYADFTDYYGTSRVTKEASQESDTPKNLVMIFAESLERTYFDQERFPGLITELRELENASTTFTNVTQVDGTGWTMGGITAALCGIPLYTPSNGNSMSGMDQFLPTANCLSDELQKQGYTLSFLGGADLTFAGKGKFFQTHGFDKVIGKDVVTEGAEEKDLSSWGLRDDALFDIGRTQFQKLAAEEKPFGLVLLTLDTHHPYGNPSASCDDLTYGDGENRILNAVKCSDRVIASFINDILESPEAEDTVIVLVSDHLALRNTATEMLADGPRANTFMIIETGNTEEEESKKEVNSEGSMIDVGSTLLPYLGFSGTVGLGRDLNSEKNRTEITFIRESLERWRTPLTQFWNFPQMKQSLTLNVGAKTFQIDGRTFGLPALIELDDDFHSTLRFRFAGDTSHDTLLDHRAAVDDEMHFLLLEFCENVQEINRELGSDGFCLVAGTGPRYTSMFPLRDDVIYSMSRADVQKILDLPIDEHVPNTFDAQRVAHAGGAYNGQTYTNSLEALEENYDKGFRYFEIDFSFTSDGELVCLHDWEDNFVQSFGFAVEEKLSLEEFESLVNNQTVYTNCTLASLKEWMSKHPDAVIVTDVKEENMKALEKITELPNAAQSVIPQIYQPENAEVVYAMGYEQIIWTLYRYAGSDIDIRNALLSFPGSFAVTMPMQKAAGVLPQNLRTLGIPSYVHTVNDPEHVRFFLEEQGVTEIYTDERVPEN